MRHIDRRFVENLLRGELAFFLNQVKANPGTLSLEIRKGYINIYYKGGNLLKITQKKREYAFHFDTKYCLYKGGRNFDLLNGLGCNDREGYQKHFNLMMEEMDRWFEEHPKPERDYQHRLLVHNPQIVDIEYQIGRQMRLDMLLFYEGRLLIVENKYGTGAIGGKAGVAAHYEDICRILGDPKLVREMKDSVCSISQAKYALGLTDGVIEPADIKGVEILFLLANYNPKSKSWDKACEKMDGSVPACVLMPAGEEAVLDLSRARQIFGANG